MPRGAVLPVACLAVLGLAALPVTRDGFSDAGLHAAILATARAAAACFLLFFVSAAAGRLHPGAAGRWLGRNERAFALAFAFSHLLHLGAILGRARVTAGASLEGFGPETWIVGGVAYLGLALLAWTSLDAGRGLLEKRAWRVLRGLGDHLIWLLFLAAMVNNTLGSLWWLPAPLVFLMALGLRLAARRRPWTHPAPS